MFRNFTWMCLVLAALSPNVWGAANPRDATSPMKYRDSASGTNHQYNLITPDSSYRITRTGWCTANHRTSAGNKYDHTHTTTSIPFTDDSRTPNVTVTATMVNYYWDAYFAGWTKSGAPTNTHNCHGYAMGQTTPLIQSTTNGSDKFRTDAGYTSISEPTASCIWSTTSHSYKITAIYDCSPAKDRVKTRSDKSNESAIYTITYASPGVDTTTNLYSK
jgi:hypothetical protein